VTTTQPLPAGVTFVAATPSQGTCAQAAGVVACALGALANGAAATIVVTVVPTALGALNTTVTASSPEPDPTTPNVATAITAVTANADLGITMIDAPDSVTVGETITYRVVVTNGGPDSAHAVTVADALPVGVTLLDVSPSQGSCTTAISCSLGTIAPAAAAVVAVTARADIVGGITNVATVSSASADANAANNTASATTTVSAAPVVPPPPPAPIPTVDRADLGLMVHTSRAGISPRAQFTALTAIVTNSGTGAATGATIALRVTGGEVVTIAKSQETCATSRTGPEQIVTCAAGRIESGSRATMAVVVQSSRRGRIGASGSVSADLADPSPADTTNVSATPQPPLGRLAIRIAAPTSVRRSQLVPYAITVRNTAQQIARDVIVAVAPPAGATALGPVAVRNPNSRTHGATPSRAITVFVGDMAPGETRVVSLITSAGRQLGSRDIEAAAIGVDGVAGAHTHGGFRVLGALRSIPVTG
jgi:uncharacterized repeat protein (TIGR01451 family)